jgi:hypothetical protein
MSQLRTVREARINFIFFQDIITCVMGILILVTLMLSLSLGDNAASPEEEQLKSELEKAKATLVQVEAENRSAEQQTLQLAALPDRVALETQISMLKRQIARTAEQLRQSQNAAAALKTEQDRAAAELQKNAAVEQQIAKMENEIATARDQLAAARVDTNSVFIIPAPDAQDARRKPVAIIVSNDKIEVRPFSGGRSQEVALSSGAPDLRPILGSLDPARQFLVFYFRPSGAKWFVEFRRLARSLAFTVGYDAVEEQQQLIFPTASQNK